MSSRLHTELCDLLGCEYPIIQTAMGWIATPELVAASCNAGGFGFLAAAVLSPDEVEPFILKTKELTDKPFGLNFHSFQPGVDHVIDMVIKHKLKAVSFGRAPDKDMIARLKEAGVLCIPTVGAAKHAQKAVAMGADAVVIQGGEGGGHTGAVPTSLLLPQVVDSVDVPVIAAGGFHDGRGLVAALAFGACGIAMGTRFLLTQESPVPATTKDKYLSADVANIPASKALDGMPQRMIMNKVLQKMDSASQPELLVRAIINGLKFRKLTGAKMTEVIKSGWDMARKTDMTLGQTIMAPNAPVLIQRAMVEGRPDEGVLPSGQVAGLIDEIPTCAELISRIIATAEARLADLAGQPSGEPQIAVGGAGAD